GEVGGVFEQGAGLVEHHVGVDVDVALGVPLGVLGGVAEAVQQREVGAERVEEGRQRGDLPPSDGGNEIVHASSSARPLGTTGRNIQWSSVWTWPARTHLATWASKSSKAKPAA